jgi:hypothetical protein
MLKVLAVIFILLAGGTAFSQAPDTPVEYMDYLSNREASLSDKYMSYMSEVAHGSRARKMEKRRQALIAEIKQNLADAGRLKPYKGDASLRDAFRSYWDILYKVFNEDYHKIVDMEEIAEQSYDNMEAYLLAQEKAGEVLDNAYLKVPEAYKQFAEKNNVKLIDNGNTKMEKKLRQVGLVNSYSHQLFLIYFKSFKQEVYMLDAFNRKDVNGMEQNKNTLLRYAEEGLAKLDTLKPFQGDGSLITACRKVLEFHKSESQQFQAFNDYLLKTDEFNKIKKAFDAKPQAKRTQEDIDAYNKAVNEMNKAVEVSNKQSVSSNTAREKVMTNWENTRKRFMDQHVPTAK